MSEAVYSPMTNTYKVDNKDGTFSTYTPAQFKEKFGATPEPVEDVADEQSDPINDEVDDKEGDDTDSENEEPVKTDSEDTVEDTVTSVDGTTTVPVAEVENAVANFNELSPEEQEKVRAEQKEAELNNSNPE